MVLIGRDDHDARHAAELAAAVGITNLGGFLAGGFTSWREEQLPVARIPRLTVEELHDQRDGLQVLDVREQAEWDAGHIPGSVHTPYHDIDGIPDELDADEPVAVICGSGQRSAVAAGLLELHGAKQPRPRRRRRRRHVGEARLAGRDGLARARPAEHGQRDQARHEHRDVGEPGDLLDHHDAAREGLTGTTSLRPVLVSVVKLRKRSSIQVRSSAGSTAAVKLPGSIACTTVNV